MIKHLASQRQKKGVWYIGIYVIINQTYLVIHDSLW